MATERVVTIGYFELMGIERDKESAEHSVKVLRNTANRLRSRNEELWRCMREMRKIRDQFACDTAALASGYVDVDGTKAEAVKIYSQRRRDRRKVSR